MPDTLTSGIVSKLSNMFGFLPKTNSYGLKFAKFGVLNVFCGVVWLLGVVPL